MAMEATAPWWLAACRTRSRLRSMLASSLHPTTITTGRQRSMSRWTMAKPAPTSASVSINITPVNDAPTGTVTITGTAAKNQVLTASSTLADADGLGHAALPMAARWLRQCRGRPGELHAGRCRCRRTPSSVVASYTDGHGTPESVASAATAAVTNVNDAPTGTVTISGTAAEGPGADRRRHAGRCRRARHAALPVAARRLVKCRGRPASYTLGDADVGAHHRVVVSYTDGHGTAESVASAATAAVTNVNDAPTGTVTISGTAAEDQVLTARRTRWPMPTGWGRMQLPVAARRLARHVGADRQATRWAMPMSAHTIDVVASYTDGHGTAESVASAATAAVTNVNDAPTGAVTISGTAAENQVLTASNTLADADGLGAHQLPVAARRRSTSSGPTGRATRWAMPMSATPSMWWRATPTATARRRA